MNSSEQIAKQFRAVHFGGNWTGVNLKETLANVSWQQSMAKVHSFNSIATLVFHINYYVAVVAKVLQGEPLNAHDKYSFNYDAVKSEDDWEKLLNKTWADAETFAVLVEQFPEAKLLETFMNEKYGSYYRNFHGVIEHVHYHLGQIVLIKKILAERTVDKTEGV